MTFYSPGHILCSGISLFVFDLMSCICCLSTMFDQRAGKSSRPFDAAEGQVGSTLLCDWLFRIILETWTSLKSLLFDTCVGIPSPPLRVDIPGPQPRIDIPSSPFRFFILNPSIRIDIPSPLFETDIASLSFRISVLRPRSELIFLVRCAGAESSANEDTKTLRTLAHQDPVTYGLGWFRGHVALQGALMMDQDCLSFFIVKLAASGTSECSKRGGTLVQDFGQKYFHGFRCGRGPISRTPERQSALSGQKIFSKEFVEGDVLAFRGC